ncbi:ABC transporter permease subunit, partial [Paraburkholderia sp. EG285A]|uniref:ABC transporter permease subunit n=1 Tax=Paraburkholderia sp. EG285A TaxID=3237009 RepID=UPI0034D26ECB
SENEGHHASKAGRPTCQQTLTADTPNVKKDQRSESVLCRPSLAAATLGATRWQLLALVVLPSALPEILTGVRIALGAGWSTLVAAELIAATRGLGFMVYSASRFLVTDVVIAGILLIGAIALALELGLRALQRKLAPWHAEE